MVKLKIEIPIEECIESVLRQAKMCIDVLDDLEKNNVSLESVFQAINADRELTLVREHGLKLNTLGYLLTMSLSDLHEARRSYYEEVVKGLTPLVIKQDE